MTPLDKAMGKDRCTTELEVLLIGAASQLERSAAALTDSLRSLISTLETIDADERFAAREERRLARVHTSTIAEAKATLDSYGVHL